MTDLTANMVWNEGQGANLTSRAPCMSCQAVNEWKRHSYSPTFFKFRPDITQSLSFPLPEAASFCYSSLSPNLRSYTKWPFVLLPKTSRYSHAVRQALAQFNISLCALSPLFKGHRNSKCQPMQMHPFISSSLGSTSCSWFVLASCRPRAETWWVSSLLSLSTNMSR